MEKNKCLIDQVISVFKYRYIKIHINIARQIVDFLIKIKPYNYYECT